MATRRRDDYLAFSPVISWAKNDAPVYTDLSDGRDFVCVYFRFDLDLKATDLAGLDAEAVKRIVSEMERSLTDGLNRELCEIAKGMNHGPSSLPSTHLA